jgi:hypothetical protein
MLARRLLARAGSRAHALARLAARPRFVARVGVRDAAELEGIGDGLAARIATVHMAL